MDDGVEAPDGLDAEDPRVRVPSDATPRGIGTFADEREDLVPSRRSAARSALP
jgi:hypothetical protein